MQVRKKERKETENVLLRKKYPMYLTVDVLYVINVFKHSLIGFCIQCHIQLQQKYVVGSVFVYGACLVHDEKNGKMGNACTIIRIDDGLKLFRKQGGNFFKGGSGWACLDKSLQFKNAASHLTTYVFTFSQLTKYQLKNSYC